MLANGIQKDRRMVWDFKGIDKIKFIDSEEFEDVLDDKKIKSVCECAFKFFYIFKDDTKNVHTLFAD